jgi:hypothetical protein
MIAVVQIYLLTAKKKNIILKWWRVTGHQSLVTICSVYDKSLFLGICK